MARTSAKNAALTERSQKRRRVVRRGRPPRLLTTRRSFRGRSESAARFLPKGAPLWRPNK